MERVSTSRILMVCGLVLVAFVGGSARPRPAHAWACPPGSFDPDVAFPRAELVFTARVIARTRVAGTDLTLTRLRVERMLRGVGLVVGAVVELRRCVGSKCGGGFRRGERLVVFGRRDRLGRVTDNGACGLTRLLGEPRGDAVLARAEQLAASTH
jgi:hypothetical protein